MSAHGHHNDDRPVAQPQRPSSVDEFESALTDSTNSTYDADRARKSPAAAGAAAGLDERRLRAERLGEALSGVDVRVKVRLEPHPMLGPGVRVTYLDLQAVFVAVASDALDETAVMREQAAAVFDADADLDYIAFVADSSAEHSTQLLSPSDVSGGRINAPNDQLADTWAAVLPIELALQRMMQFAAPEWGDFAFDSTFVRPLELRRVLAEQTARVLQRETRRPYRAER